MRVRRAAGAARGLPQDHRRQRRCRRRPRQRAASPRLAREETGDATGAIDDYDNAIAANPRLAAAYFSRGAIYLELCEPGRAIADFSEAIKLDPKLVIAYDRRGMCYGYTGDPKRAMADFDTAIRIDPSFTDAYWHRGRTYEGAKDTDRAIADYTTLIRLAPNDTRGYFGRATCTTSATTCAISTRRSASIRTTIGALDIRGNVHRAEGRSRSSHRRLQRRDHAAIPASPTPIMSAASPTA